MKKTIAQLKSELKSVMTNLRGQKVNYDEIKAQRKFTKIIDKERNKEREAEKLIFSERADSSSL